jgi:hypothetical protein
MKHLLYITLIALALATAAFAPTTEDSDAEVSVTGAASGLFPAGAGLGLVSVDSLDLGTGVFIASDGSATGAFHAVLAGHSILGDEQQITVDGKVTAGGAAISGNTTFSGTATLDLGDGTPSIPGVGFSVMLTADGVVLAVDSTTLPSAALTAGAITVE